MSNKNELRNDVESFLFDEAELLDNWKLPEWAELYTADGKYEVASMSSDHPLIDDPATSIFIISDDREEIGLRTDRLMKKTAH